MERHTLRSSARQTPQQKIERRRGEHVHVGEAVAAAGLERHRRRLQARHRHAAVAGGVAIAVTGRPSRPGLGQAPIGGKALSDLGREQFCVDFRSRTDSFHRLIRDIHQDPTRIARIDHR